jgi:CAAD domains of cyanobacterial aminoacyl-tRNA synthetase
MEAQVQQSEYLETNAQLMRETPESEPVALLPPASDSTYNTQWQRIQRQTAVFLENLPRYVANFFEENQKPLTNIGLILAVLISLRVAQAVLDALNGVPLIQSTFELIGIGYTIWFINRYLLKAENRHEFWNQFEWAKRQVVGE